MTVACMCKTFSTGVLEESLYNCSAPWPRWCVVSGDAAAKCPFCAADQNSIFCYIFKIMGLALDGWVTAFCLYASSEFEVLMHLLHFVKRAARKLYIDVFLPATAT